jgi:hypothetical protein
LVPVFLDGGRYDSIGLFNKQARISQDCVERRLTKPINYINVEVSEFKDKNN